jgi:hypothetical protein
MNPSFISNNEVDALKDQVLHLQQELRVLCETSSLSTATRSIDEQMRDMKHQLKLLQQRITGNGVQIGTKVFQSFEDVKTWVKTNLPTRRYGLFWMLCLCWILYLRLTTLTLIKHSLPLTINKRRGLHQCMKPVQQFQPNIYFLQSLGVLIPLDLMIVNTYRLFRTLPNGTPATQV